jgi:hypothetical protein
MREEIGTEHLLQYYEAVMADIKFHVEMEHKRVVASTTVLTAIGGATVFVLTAEISPDEAWFFLVGPFCMLMICYYALTIVRHSGRRNLEALSIKIKLDHLLGFAGKQYAKGLGISPVVPWAKEGLVPSSYVMQTDAELTTEVWVDQSLKSGMNKMYNYYFGVFAFAAIALAARCVQLGLGA